MNQDRWKSKRILKNAQESLTKPTNPFFRKKSRKDRKQQKSKRNDPQSQRQRWKNPAGSQKRRRIQQPNEIASQPTRIPQKNLKHPFKTAPIKGILQGSSWKRRKGSHQKSSKYEIIAELSIESPRITENPIKNPKNLVKIPQGSNQPNSLIRYNPKDPKNPLGSQRIHQRESRRDPSSIRIPKNPKESQVWFKVKIQLSWFN